MTLTIWVIIEMIRAWGHSHCQIVELPFRFKACCGSYDVWQMGTNARWALVWIRPVVSNSFHIVDQVAFMLPAESHYWTGSDIVNLCVKRDRAMGSKHCRPEQWSAGWIQCLAVPSPGWMVLPLGEGLFHGGRSVKPPGVTVARYIWVHHCSMRCA